MTNGSDGRLLLTYLLEPPSPHHHEEDEDAGGPGQKGYVRRERPPIGRGIRHFDCGQEGQTPEFKAEGPPGQSS